MQQSDPIGCKSAVLHHAAQPPGESAAGDGIEGNYLVRVASFRLIRDRLQNAANVQVSTARQSGQFTVQVCGFTPQANPVRIDILQDWI